MKQKAPKLLLLLFLAYAMVRMWHWRIGFTFFTQLSNLYVGVLCLFELLTGKRVPRLKFTGAVSIAITFFVFLTVLGPVMPGGLLGAYAQDHYASLCLHLIIPAIALYDFLANDYATCFWGRCDLAISLLPPVLYLVFILLLGKAGVRWGMGNMVAPYLFLNYQAPAGWFGFRPETFGFSTLGIGVAYCILVFLLLFLLMGTLLLRLGKRLQADR